MRNSFYHRALVTAFGVVAFGARVVWGGVDPAEQNVRGLDSKLANLPLHFEATEGQNTGEHQFVARGNGCSFFVAADQAVLALTKYEGVGKRDTRSAELHFNFVGANAAACISGANELPGKANYFLGSDPAQWRRGVSLFERVRVEQMYPGVDVVYYGNESQLEYDFIVAPHADPKQIAISFAGADKIQVNRAGELEFTLGSEVIRQPKPIVYQTVKGERREIAGDYVLAGGKTVMFKLGDYEHGLPLVIDPILGYSTFYGGSGIDIGRSVKVDKNGFVYIAGETMGGLINTNPPSGPLGSFHGGTKSHGDAFVAKIDNGGGYVVYVAYIGGRSNDVAMDLAVDDNGNAFITGFTDSTDFPRKNAFQSQISGPTFPGSSIHLVDGFVTELSATGTNLVFSTYLGGTWIDEGTGIALDNEGSVYVAGYTESTNGFPETNMPVPDDFAGYHGLGDAFVAKVTPGVTNIAKLEYLMYLGGTNLDFAAGIAVNKTNGNAFVTGYTTSIDFPTTTNAVQPLIGGGQDAFVTVIGSDVSATNSGILMSTYYGGPGHNTGYRIALDVVGNFYVTGETTADGNFPVTPSGINPGGIFRNDDGATNWVALNSGLSSVTVAALAIDPTNPQNIYAGTYRGMAQSTDGGATWNPATVVVTSNITVSSAIKYGSVQALAIDKNVPNTVYAGTATEGVFFSTNSGAVWTRGGKGLLSKAVSALLVVNDANPVTVFAGTAAGVSRSTNGGVTWGSANNGIGAVQVRALAFGASSEPSPATLYAATADGVFRSITAGASWIRAGLSNTSVQALVLDPSSPTTLYAGSPRGISKTTDRGDNWVTLNTGLSTTNVTALVINPTTLSVLYAGTPAGVFKSVDGGTNWVKQSTNGLPIPNVLSLALNGSTLYVGSPGLSTFGAEDVFVWKGPNGYSTVFGGLGNDEGWGIAVDSDNNAHVTGWTTSVRSFPVVNNNGVLRGTNMGQADVFISKLSSDGGAFLLSGYLGGTNSDYANSIALDQGGNAYVVGTTLSKDFPVLLPGQASKSGTNDTFLAKITYSSAPSLNIDRSGKKVLLSWPSYLGEFDVQYTIPKTIVVTNILKTTNDSVINTFTNIYTNVVFSGTWTLFSEPVVSSNGLRVMTVDATNSARYYRLKH